ncbi:MAG: 1-acyl-sn-glycerol-3-phosphate acyltransferase [candidate division Zixibacteria bacterium]|nr:1-acyl-sn-glycerol-3-phosphate acyltransferase [candidate division Zixibacteria bacterium]
MRLLYLIGWIISWVAARLIFRMKVHYKDNIPGKGAFILASNHISMADPQFVGSVVTREIHFLAKKELFNNRFFASILTKLNTHPVNRTGFDKKVMETAAGILRAGEPILMFPEGTRGKNGKLKSARPGIGKIARTAKIPVVPAYVSGTDKLLACFFGKEKLNLYIGSSITIENIESYTDDKNGYRELANETMKRIKDLKTESDRRVN